MLNSNFDATQYYWHLPEVIAADDIEAINNIIWSRPNIKTLVLDVTKFRRCHFSAEGRLLGMLLRVHRQNKRIRVWVDGHPNEDDTSAVWETLKTSPVGLILSHLSIFLEDSDEIDHKFEIRMHQKDLLLKNAGFILHQSEKDDAATTISLFAPVMDEFDKPKTSKLMTQIDLPFFTLNFKRCLYQNMQLPPIDDVLMQNIIDFVFEAFTNTVDHALKDFDDMNINHMRFINVRAVDLSKVSADSLIEDKVIHGAHTYADPISSYLSEVIETGIDPRYLVEITVTDSGYGIPARMEKVSRGGNIPIEMERELLHKAILPGGTSKEKSIQGSGFGLTHIMQAVERLNGLILFRTGQLNMFRHYLHQQDEPDWSNDNPRHRESPFRLIDWADTPYKRIEGTSVSLMFPWGQLGDN